MWDARQAKYIVNPEYTIRRQDILHLTAADEKLIEKIDSIPPPPALAGIELLGGTNRSVRTFRAPVASLRSLQGLSVRVSGETQPLYLCDITKGDESPSKCKFEFEQKPVQEVVEKLGKLNFQNLPVTWSVVPVEATRVEPGDTLFLTRDSFVAATSNAPAIAQSDRYPLLVDPTGRVSLPSLSVVSNNLHAPNLPAEFYPVAASIEAGNMTIPVVLPGEKRSCQPSLEEVAWCLSAGYVSRPRTPPEACIDNKPEIEQLCQHLGITRVHLPDKPSSWRTNVRIRLEPGPRTWTLVDKDNARQTFPYVFGVTILDAVFAAYRGMYGHELVDREHGRVYVVVVPRPTVSSDLERAFFEEVRHGETHNLELGRRLLMPGDTVLVTRLMPLSE